MGVSMHRTVVRAFSLRSGFVPVVLVLVVLIGLPLRVAIVMLSPPNADGILAFVLLAAGRMADPLIFGAVISGLATEDAGGPVSLRGVLTDATRWYGRMLVVIVAFLAATAVAALALVVPGVLVGTRYFLAPVIVALEGGGLRSSARRSAHLTEGIRTQIGLVVAVGWLGQLVLGLRVGLASVAVYYGLIALNFRFLPPQLSIALILVVSDFGVVYLGAISYAFYVEARDARTVGEGAMPHLV